ncbi:hypothetical protein FRB96_009475 [Tulasnella sp. 330]|nr:hypothetical protein FRB96_009475 [Tulasnella sp. 330]
MSLRDAFLSAMQKSPVEGFMFALSMMQGAASALQYLSGELRIGTDDLKSCMQVTNMRLSPRGKVVVGHGFILSPPTQFDVSDLSKWLIRHFWCMTMEVLYGDVDAIKPDNWSSVQSIEKHVHPLETLVAYDCPNFVFMTKRLTDILTPLEGLRRCSGGELTYLDIRTQLLRAPQVDLCFFYHPPEPMEVSLGDIGYIDAGGSSFVRLSNIGDDVPITAVPNESVEYVTASPPHHHSEHMNDGTMRHKFYNPIHVSIVRQGEARNVKDIVSLWPHFIRQAPKLAEKARQAGISPEDLILITAILKGRRATRLEFKPESHYSQAMPPFEAEFLERFDDSYGANWGTWVVSGTEVKDPTRKMETEWTLTPTGHRVKMRISRYRQRIEFMQMSRSDYAPIGAACGR